MQTPTHQSSMRLLRPKDAAAMLAISPNTLWRWTRERKDFPSPVKLGPGSTAWRLADLEAFIASRD